MKFQLRFEASEALYYGPDETGDETHGPLYVETSHDLLGKVIVEQPSIVVVGPFYSQDRWPIQLTYEFLRIPDNDDTVAFIKEGLWTINDDFPVAEVKTLWGEDARYIARTSEWISQHGELIFSDVVVEVLD